MHCKIGNVSFDSADPTSVQAVVREMEQVIDRKVAPYRNNPLVNNI